MPTPLATPYPEGATYVLRAHGDGDDLPQTADGPVRAADPGTGRGNLGATFQWARDHAVPPGGVRLIHDGGVARRALAWAGPLHGRRSRLPLPGRWPTLLDAVIAWAPPVSPGHVDLLWTSQLVAAPPSPAPTARLTKWVAALDPSTSGALQLGWFASGPPLRMLPGRSATDVAALLRWANGDALWTDVGNTRLQANWLADLADAWDGTPCDLDPQLTAPWLRGAMPWLGSPDVALWRVPTEAWWRLRHAHEVHAALRDPGLLGRLTGGQPCLRATAGGERLDGLTVLDLHRGVHIGGCWLRDVTLTDVHLAPGSHLDGVTAVRGEGRWEAAASVLLEARGDVQASNALLLRPEGAPRAMVDGTWAGDQRHAWSDLGP
jgi:hypothetical protein